MGYFTLHDPEPLYNRRFRIDKKSSYGCGYKPHNYITSVMKGVCLIVCLFFIYFRTVTPISNKFGVMVEDVHGVVIDTLKLGNVLETPKNILLLLAPERFFLAY
jgi:hypothetical protein